MIFQFLSKQEDDTIELGQFFAQLLKPGIVVILNGPLAAGKTTLIRSLVRELGYDEVVTSPTYTLANVYPTTNFDIIHSDFYRLKSSHEIEGLGLDLYAEKSIILVEWGDKFERYFDFYLRIDIAYGENDVRVFNVITDYLSTEDRKAYDTLLNAKLN